MKTMLLSDLTVIRSYLLQTLIIACLVSVFMAVAMRSTIVISACITSMIPLLTAFSLLAYDEINDWQSFRLSLPLSRTDVVCGRYATVFVVTVISAIVGLVIALIVALIAQALGPTSFLAPLSMDNGSIGELVAGSLAAGSIALIMIAAFIPPAMKSGMTKGVRYTPFVIMALFLLGSGAFGEGGVLEPFAQDLLYSLGSGSTSLVIVSAIIAVVSVILFAISMQVSKGLYATREL